MFRKRNGYSAGGAGVPAPNLDSVRSTPGVSLSLDGS